jgi:hypothetical protein
MQLSDSQGHGHVPPEWLIHSIAASRKSRAAFIKPAKFSRSGFIVNADIRIVGATARARLARSQ